MDGWSKLLGGTRWKDNRWIHGNSNCDCGIGCGSDGEWPQDHTDHRMVWRDSRVGWTPSRKRSCEVAKTAKWLQVASCELLEACSLQLEATSPSAQLCNYSGSWKLAACSLKGWLERCGYCVA